MPIYEYLCPVCGHKFELLRRFYDSDKDVVCPHCGDKSVIKQQAKNSATCDCEVSYRTSS
jgi:putative FmdB family regulatory protein